MHSLVYKESNPGYLSPRFINYRAKHENNLPFSLPLYRNVSFIVLKLNPVICNRSFRPQQRWKHQSWTVQRARSFLRDDDFDTIDTRASWSNVNRNGTKSLNRMWNDRNIGKNINNNINTWLAVPFHRYKWNVEISISKDWLGRVLSFNNGDESCRLIYHPKDNVPLSVLTRNCRPFTTTRWSATDGPIRYWRDALLDKIDELDSEYLCPFCKSKEDTILLTLNWKSFNYRYPTGWVTRK